ncbi:MAG: hypothetical protein GX240_01960 [Candidatus Atribacteria bacterium]|jgi:hypothetical protein|nr:hypothetical protein [Candidatus Atribacteria bacterium]
MITVKCAKCKKLYSNTRKLVREIYGIAGKAESSGTIAFIREMRLDAVVVILSV